MPGILGLITTIFATVLVGFGFNALYRPQSALSFFELEYPTENGPHKVLVDTLLAVYAVRDIFMGVAMYTAVYHGAKRTLGYVTLAVGGVAAADGIICKMIVGHGEWNHWGYAPMAGLVGLALLVV